MPSTDIFYKPGAGQPAFTVETRVSGYTEADALGSSEPTAKTITAKFWQMRENYMRPPENDPLSYGTQTAYFVDDSPRQDITAGLVEWTRTWATVPASWSDPEEYPYTYPAFTGATSYGTAYNVTDITQGSGNYVLTTTATGISANDSVYISLSYVRGSKTYRANGFYRAVAATSGASVTIPNVIVGTGGFGSVSGTISKSTPGRSIQETKVVGSRWLHEYALTDMASLDLVLPLLQPFTPIDNLGNIVTTLLTGTATNPSSTAYAAMITSGGELVAECTRRTFIGNIYVRRTRLVPAL